MRILVQFMSKQTVIQASVVREALPDFILFFTTPYGAEEQWYKNIPVVAVRADGMSIPYRNVFIERQISLSHLVETVKKHVHEIRDKDDIDEIVLDASSGKGIHRILVTSYLKNFCMKHDIVFNLVYFDTDTRKISKVNIYDYSFSQTTKPISVDWELEDRLSIFGAHVRDYTLIFNPQHNYFSENYGKYNELYASLQSSMQLRSFFMSYENIKFLVSEHQKMNNFFIENFVRSEIKSFIRHVFGIIPHTKKSAQSSIETIKNILSDFYEDLFLDFFENPTYSSDYRSEVNQSVILIEKEMQKKIIGLLTPLCRVKKSVHKVRDILPGFLRALHNNIIDRVKIMNDLRFISYPETLFDTFTHKYIKQMGEHDSQTNRAQIAMLFEKIVSFAVYKAIINNETLRNVISAVYQNVKLDGTAGSLIELDTMVLFKNGSIHIFEAKTSHIYNKDINSKMLVLRRYLGENVEMDIVFPFKGSDIERIREKDGKHISEFHRSGLKNVNTWLNFFSSTDKSLIGIDRIEQRLLDIAFNYM